MTARLAPASRSRTSIAKRVAALGHPGAWSPWHDAELVERLRRIRPEARIIHEIQSACQGPNRIDLIAVSRSEIIAVEIKSERDKLDRLPAQVGAMLGCAHHVIAALHERFLAEPAPTGTRRVVCPAPPQPRTIYLCEAPDGERSLHATAIDATKAALAYGHGATVSEWEEKL